MKTGTTIQNQSLPAPHAQFVSANLVAESTDRGRCPCNGLDIFFRISNRQTD